MKCPTNFSLSLVDYELPVISSCSDVNHRQTEVRRTGAEIY